MPVGALKYRDISEMPTALNLVSGVRTPFRWRPRRCTLCGSKCTAVECKVGGQEYLLDGRGGRVNGRGMTWEYTRHYPREGGSIVRSGERPGPTLTIISINLKSPFREIRAKQRQAVAT